MGLYESWARQLLPTVAFPDFVAQLERMSGNQAVMLKQINIEQGYEDWAVDTDVDAVSPRPPQLEVSGVALPFSNSLCRER